MAVSRHPISIAVMVPQTAPGRCDTGHKNALCPPAPHKNRLRRDAHHNFGPFGAVLHCNSAPLRTVEYLRPMQANMPHLSYAVTNSLPR
jgi:hypothetical protein